MLTGRGRRLLLLGFVITGVGLGSGLRDAESVGVVMVLLPLAAAAWVTLRRPRIEVARQVSPARVTAGSAARVLLTISNPSRFRSAPARAEDTVPSVLGAPPRFTVPSLEGSGRRRAAYDIHSPVRGRFILGPTVFRHSDPFGLWVQELSADAVGVLVVTPPVVPLSPLARTVGQAAGGGPSARSLASRGEDDMGVRIYRQGDDLRRVHWRTTARTGQLMVRQEEQPTRRRPRLLLDTRRWAHRGTGADASFEWAVAAVAAIGAHLSVLGDGLHAVSDLGDTLVDSNNDAGAGVLLEKLAEVEPSGGASLAPAAAVLAAGTGLLIAVCGTLRGSDVTALTAAARTGGVAFLLDVAAWPDRDVDPHARLAEYPARAAGDLETDDAARRLRAQGWIVVVIRAGDRLEDSWNRASLATGSGIETRVAR